MDIVELTDHFRTATDRKCQLGEAYRAVFTRAFAAHKADDDAKATMELYKHWEANKKQKVILQLASYCVTIHSVKPAENRPKFLWEVLRPEKGGRDTLLLIKDDGAKLSMLFREQRERDAYAEDGMIEKDLDNWI